MISSAMPLNEQQWDHATAFIESQPYHIAGITASSESLKQQACSNVRCATQP